MFSSRTAETVYFKALGVLIHEHRFPDPEVSCQKAESRSAERYALHLQTLKEPLSRISGKETFTLGRKLDSLDNAAK